jgi:hypothetical protein
VTRRTGPDDPLAGPVGDAFTMGTSYPIVVLSEMALTAELVAVIHIYFLALFAHQKIALILLVTGETG